MDVSLDGKVALVTGAGTACAAAATFGVDVQGALAADALSMGLSDAVLADITWHNCFRFLGIDPPKLFSSREQRHFPRTGRSPPARAVDLTRRRRAAAAAAAADLAR